MATGLSVSETHGSAPRCRTQYLSANELLNRSIRLDDSSPSRRVISASQRNATWRALAIRASMTLAVVGAVLAAGHGFNQLVTNPSVPPSLAETETRTHLAAAHPNAGITAGVDQPTEAAKPFVLPAFNASLMVVSVEYKTKLKQDEALRLNSYLDNGKTGTWTIGYGHTGFMPDGRPIGPGMTVTKNEAEALFDLDVQAHVNKVVEILGDVPVTQAQFEALVDFSYNKGPLNLQSSTLFKKLSAGDYVGAADEYLKWTKVTVRDENNNPVLDEQGRRVMEELPGLVTRAKEKRAAMLSSFSPATLDTLERGVEGITAADRLVQRTARHLENVKVTGTNVGADIQRLEKMATKAAQHIDALQRKIASADVVIGKLKATSASLSQSYEAKMGQLGPHLDADDPLLLKIGDLANQSHVLTRVAVTHEIKRDRDVQQLAHYRQQVELLRHAADTLKTGVHSLQATKNSTDNEVSLLAATETLDESVFRIREAVLRQGSSEAGVALLGERDATRLIATLSSMRNNIEDSLDGVAQARVQRELARNTF